MSVAAIKIFNEANVRVAIVEVPPPVKVVIVAAEGPKAIIVGQQGPQGPAGPGVDELLQELTFAQLNRYVKFTYASGNLVKKEIFEDNTEAVQLFDVDYIYNVGGDLTQIDVERVSDGASYSKLLSYSGGNLSSIEVI